MLAAPWVEYPFPEQMNRKLSRNVWETRSSSSQKRPGLTGHFTASRFTDHCSSATRHYHTLPPAGNWARFSCSIPRLFVLSRNMSTINTTGKLASFWRFSITARSIPSDSLVTILSPHASRRHPPGQVMRGPSTPGYCPTPTAELARTEPGPTATSGLFLSV